tara:strand:- start:22 stop:258 length:237 start_codon:yes stop_codon:yes gene_type:complete
MTNHVVHIKENTIYQLRLRKDFLEDAIGEIEFFWEPYGGLEKNLHPNHSQRAKDDSVALIIHNKELTDCKNLIKLIQK